jgi:hypothetical protein
MPSAQISNFWDVDTLTTPRLGASSQRANPSIRCLDPASTPLKLSISTEFHLWVGGASALNSNTKHDTRTKYINNPSVCKQPAFNAV